MKDLFLLTADADAEAILRSVLPRHKALGIRSITFDIRRFPGRDAGMVNKGPETVRVLAPKKDYSRVALFWDYHGSGWESRTPDDGVKRIQQRLDGVTWSGRSDAIVMVPELEEWLWRCPQSIATHLGITHAELEAAAERAADKLGKSVTHCRREMPKELFEIVLHFRKRRQPLPEDFKALGARADLELWQASESFARMTGILRNWFPG